MYDRTFTCRAKTSNLVIWLGVCLSLHMDNKSQDVDWHRACLLGAHMSHLGSS